MMRFISTAQRCFNAWPNKASLSMFSSVARGNGSTQKAYEDWEYCKMITHELKNNNIQSALSLLFQSYLNDQILDIQIYKQIYEKIDSSSLELSYAEIAFPASCTHVFLKVLRTACMNKLTHSKNQHLLVKLRKDYELLGEPYPARSSRRAKREARKGDNLEKQQKTITIKPKDSPIALNTFLKNHFPSFDQMHPPNIHTFNQDLSAEDFFRMKLSSQLKDILLQLNIPTNGQTYVDVKGVRVEFDKDPQGEEELPSDEQFEFQENTNEFKRLFGCDINRITIDKLQLIKEDEE